jgi:general secretion pathway protein I
MSSARRIERGFSLLEVMIAVGILSLAISLVMASQTGLVASNSNAIRMATATALGRCRMTEIEERLLLKGYPELDENDSADHCCEDDEHRGYSCAWKIERVVLPNPNALGSADGGASSAFGAIASAAGGLDGGAPPLGSISDGGLQGIGQSAAGQYGQQGAGGLVSMAFGLLYPSLKPVLEVGIRRLTVTVKWREGITDKTFSVVQFVTNPARTGLVATMNPDGDGGIVAPPPTTSTAAPLVPGAK